tara:strand:- start:511 stop:1989 length:1479 start_codon:yes stop_codon:yes gene_type:complete
MSFFKNFLRPIAAGGATQLSARWAEDRVKADKFIAEAAKINLSKGLDLQQERKEKKEELIKRTNVIKSLLGKSPESDDIAYDVAALPEDQFLAFVKNLQGNLNELDAGDSLDLQGLGILPTNYTPTGKTVDSRINELFKISVANAPLANSKPRSERLKEVLRKETFGQYTPTELQREGVVRAAATMGINPEEFANLSETVSPTVSGDIRTAIEDPEVGRERKQKQSDFEWANTKVKFTDPRTGISSTITRAERSKLISEIQDAENLSSLIAGETLSRVDFTGIAKRAKTAANGIIEGAYAFDNTTGEPIFAASGEQATSASILDEIIGEELNVLANKKVKSRDVASVTAKYSTTASLRNIVRQKITDGWFEDETNRKNLTARGITDEAITTFFNILKLPPTSSSAAVTVSSIPTLGEVINNTKNMDVGAIISDAKDAHKNDRDTQVRNIVLSLGGDVALQGKVAEAFEAADPSADLNARNILKILENLNNKE